jgi:alpha-glucosidase (family GH31 glycosyl hydrolase)
VSSEDGKRMRLTAYGSHLFRIQAVRKGEEFYPDTRYDMIENLPQPDSLVCTGQDGILRLASLSDTGIAVQCDEKTFRLSFFMDHRPVPFLAEKEPIRWRGENVAASFAFDPEEHFTGLGHGYYGRAESIDLRGTFVHRNYGSDHSQQAPLIVPFYLSDKGYGVFLNSTFPNTFSFGHDGIYGFSLAGGESRMDYFVILGPDFAQVLDRYTQLTGRPRFPPEAALGLGLSDKGNDETSADPSDEAWWKKKIEAHRAAGFPIDHIINDNRWRAGGGKRCESYIEWDTTRFPDPREYETWVKANGLMMTVDANRCVLARSDGWKPSFTIPQARGIEFGFSAPDFTNPEVRSWFWQIFWRKVLNPELGYPGDALWIDEMDEMGKAPSSMILFNGRSWAEMRNSWFLLIAEALVRDGWDKRFGGQRRPFVWVRGMTAGGQRYATLWSGDIKPSYDDMKLQVRGMQLAGLSGFPFWGHDAGGFNDWETGKGPDDAMYRQWSMAFGSFSPFWKPHGMGQSRWPLDRPAEVQADAHTYTQLRYRLMPYLYTYAHEASETGMPIARAMVIDHQHDPAAWTHDLQYMWGKELLVAPNCSDSGEVSLWLPDGGWYAFWSDSLLEGNRVIDLRSPIGVLPLFVRSGSIIPMAPFALGTALIPRDSLIVHLYPGRDASFSLYEDDGYSEGYRTSGSFRKTHLSYVQETRTLTIGQGVGSYQHAPGARDYLIIVHHVESPECVEVNGVRVAQRHVTWDSTTRRLTIEGVRSPARSPCTFFLPADEGRILCATILRIPALAFH